MRSHASFRIDRAKAVEMLLKRIEKVNDNMLSDRLGSGWGRTEQVELTKYSEENSAKT